MINQTVLDIYIVPSEDRAYEEDFNVSKVNLTFDVVKYEQDELDIQLKFDYPLEISRSLK